MNVQVTHPVLPDPGINTWHLRTDAADPVSGDTIALVNAVSDFYVLLLDSVLAQGAVFSFSGDFTTVEASPRAISGHHAWTAGNAGSSATLPPANCLVIGWGTSSATRRGRGRTFLGPIQQAANDATGTVSTAALANARAAADGLLADIAAVGNGGIGVYSRVDSVLRDYVSRTVHDKFAVLRSRRD
jgi:hypothetical protein